MYLDIIDRNSPFFVAPEMYSTYSNKVDVYSFGKIIAEYWFFANNELVDLDRVPKVRVRLIVQSFSSAPQIGQSLSKFVLTKILQGDLHLVKSCGH